MNTVILIGRLTKDPEVRYTQQTQMAVARFNLALNRGKDKDGNDKGADFPSIVVFGRSAENCEKYLHKGDQVAIRGRLQTGSYEKDGRKVYTTDVVADSFGGVEFLGKSKGGNTHRSETEDVPEDIPDGFSMIDDDDIPF